MASVTLHDVVKRYPDGYQAITDLNLEIQDGEFMIFVGPSGCGKSTALRMIAGLEDITDGELRIGDQVVNAMSPKERDIAMVFQSYALYPHMSVYDNMGFSLKLSKVPKEEIDRAVREAAEILDLTELLERKPAALSGGQRQRVAMGRAIVRSPKAFLMDEPLSNLDAKLRVAMRAEIAALQNRLAVTTIYVTHDQVEAMTMGDRVAVLKKGVLQQVDAPQQLYDHPDNLFVAGFIGSPAMNIMEGQVVKNDGQLAVKLGATKQFPIPDAALQQYGRVADRVGSTVAVGMRPEHFFHPSEGATEEQTWAGRNVTLVELLGSEAYVHFGTSAPPVISEDMREAMDDDDAFEDLKRQAQQGGQVLTAKMAPHQVPKIGELVDVAFDTTRFHFFDMETGLALR